MKFIKTTILLCLIFIISSSYSLANVNQSEFKVVFSGNPVVSNKNNVKASVTNNYNATINVSGLTMQTNEESATFIIQNTSKDLFAEIDVEISNSNTEYFSVETIVEDDFLINGEATNVVVKINLLKEPTNETENAVIGIQLNSKPRQPGEKGNETNFKKDESEENKNFITNIIEYYEKDTTPKTGDFKFEDLLGR